MVGDAGKLSRVAILGGLRLPFVRAGGALEDFSTLDLVKVNLKALVDRYGLQGETLGDVVLGTVFYHPSVWNLSREVVLASGLSPQTPALGIQRACATSLEAAIALGNKIALGQIDVGVAGGAESLSNVGPYFAPRFSRTLTKSAQAKGLKNKALAFKQIKFSDLKPAIPATVEATTGKSMGQHCEMMAKTWKISREEQDELALKSHQNGIAAYDRHFYDELVEPFHGVKMDSILRRDTSKEKMAKLKPAFDPTPAGTLTAGNSSPLTDGSACLLLASEAWAKQRAIEPLAYLVDYETAAIDLKEEGLLMAPAYAVARMLSRRKLKLQDFDYYEIHEAFAAQVLCTLRAWESETFCKQRLGLDAPLGSIDRSKLNVVGGSVALGHPFGATGARLLATASKLLKEKGKGRALLSICTGGGMGTTVILER